MPFKDPDVQKTYLREYHRKRSALLKSQSAQIETQKKAILIFVRQILKIITKSTPLDDHIDKYEVSNGEYDDNWTDDEKIKWYKGLVLYIISVI
jgi:hypothetical protein